jgi:hypothetical protein
MTELEIISIKKYVKGAYPNMKDTEISNIVWIDLLQDEEYYGILQSVKNYIKDGNKFPPTVGEVIKGYNLIINKFRDDILNKMEDDGVFDDPDSTDIEIAMWNKKNRKRKTLIWSANLSKAPEWFVKIYKSYETNQKALVFKSQKRLN